MSLRETSPYAAFVSYRQAEPDRTFARNLHRFLEAYAPPKVGTTRSRRLGKCFIDEEEISAGGISDNLREALVRSQSFVVICSPRTLESAWVHEEVSLFLASHEELVAIAVLIEGTEEASVPAALRALSGCTIIATGNDTSGRAVKRVGRAIAARILGVSDATLAAAERTRLRLRLGLAAALTTLLALGVYAGLLWTRTDSYQIARVLADAEVEAAVIPKETTALEEWIAALAARGEKSRASRDLALLTRRIEAAFSRSVLASMNDVVEEEEILRFAAAVDRLGFPEEAMGLWRIIERSAAAAPPSGPGSSTPEGFGHLQRVALAESLAGAGRLAEAARVLPDALLSKSADAFMTIEFAKALAHSGRPEAGLALFQRCCAEAAIDQDIIEFAIGFARAGKPDRAVELLEPLFDAQESSEPFRKIVAELIRGGRPGVAETVLRSLRDGPWDSHVFLDLVDAAVAREAIGEARLYALVIDDEASSGRAFLRIAEKTGADGDFEAARKAVLAADPIGYRCRVLMEIDVAHAQRSGSGRFAANVTALFEKIRTIDSPRERARCFSHVADAAVRLEQPQIAARAWQSILAIEQELVDSTYDAEDLLPLAEARAHAGRETEALELWETALTEMRAYGDAEYRLFPLRLSLARAGRLTNALDVVRYLGGGATHGEDYERLTNLVALFTRAEQRKQLLAEAAQRPPEEQVALLIAFADVVRKRNLQAATDAADRALVAAKEITDERQRSSAIAAVALRFVQQRRLRDARLTAMSGCLPADRLRVLAGIVTPPAGEVRKKG